MSHEIDMSNGRANIAYVGEVPWHGLGQQLSADATIEEWRVAAGLDWEAVKSPVRYIDAHGGEALMPNRFVLHRSDTGLPLSIVSGQYHVVQPGDVLGFFEQIIEHVGGFKMETAGVLQEGRKVWALAKGEDKSVLGKTDPLHRYLMLATSYDFSLATVAVQTSIRTVCMNTLRAALSAEDSKCLRLIHRSALDEDELREKLGLDVEWQAFAAAVNKLVDVRVSDTQASDYFMNLLYPEQVRKLPSFNADTAKKAVNRLWATYKEAPGQTVSTANGTAWGLVNAVTYWLDHETKARSTSARMNTAWFGSGAQLKSRALQQALVLS